MTNLTPKQLDALVHELTSDADGMRSLAWMRAHVLAWSSDTQLEAYAARFPARADRIATFRRDCVEALVGNTCDNVHDTGNSLGGVSIPEAAAYFLVDAAYDPSSVAEALVQMGEIVADCLDSDVPEWAPGAGRWDEEDVKTEVVPQLRRMAVDPRTRDTLQQCSDIIEGLVEPGLCSRQDDCDCGACGFEDALDAIGALINPATPKGT